ncbi:MAG TPA: AsnC family transcriptional regulator [Thermoplasmata archaeon]|nr:AsnC family transcriptional regulator [Thermoplasmata archaeon]
MREGLDEKDRSIVAFLQTDPEVSHREIAAQVRLSQPSVSARIARLRKMGYLAIQAGVDVSEVGLTLAKVDIATPDPAALLDTFRGCPLLVNAILTSGRANLTMFFVGETAEHLQAVVDVHLRPLADVEILDFQFVTGSIRPWVLPVSMIAGRCDRTQCGFLCPSCRYYREDRCTGCPATIHYKGRFWRS